MRFEGRTLLALSLLVLAGCGENQPCFLSGTVLVDKVPAEGVYVMFEAVAGTTTRKSSGTARADADGSFTLMVDAPGEWKITAFWPKVTQKDGDTIEGADQFGGFYRDPQRGIPNATIHEGDNALPPIMLSKVLSDKSTKAVSRDRR